MGITSSTSVVRQNVSSTPRITNLSLPTANTEVSHTLVNTLRQILIRSRSRHKLQISFVSTESATKYVTIQPGAVFSQDGIELQSGMLYIQSDQAASVAEILEWS